MIDYDPKEYPQYHLASVKILQEKNAEIERLTAKNKRLLTALRTTDTLMVNMAEKLGKLDREKAVLHRRIEELEAVLKCMDENFPLMDGITLSEATARHLAQQQDFDDLDTLPTMGEMAATYRGKIE